MPDVAGIVIKTGLKPAFVAAIFKHVFHEPADVLEVDDVDAMSLYVAAWLQLELKNQPERALNALVEIQGFIQDVADNGSDDGPADPALLTIIDNKFVTWGDMSEVYDTVKDKRWAELPYRPIKSVAYDLSVLYYNKFVHQERMDATRPQEEPAAGEALQTSG